MTGETLAIGLQLGIESLGVTDVQCLVLCWRCARQEPDPRTERVLQDGRFTCSRCPATDDVRFLTYAREPRPEAEREALDFIEGATS